MRKNIKIKLLSTVIKYFIVLSIFLFLTPLYSFSQGTINGEKKNKDLEILPG